MGIERKVLRLREHLALTQSAFARVSGLARAEVNALETGRNQGTSARIRQQLAIGAGVELEALTAYLDGKTSLARLYPEPTALDKALAIDSWPTEVIAAARELEGRGTAKSPKRWVAVLNKMEQRVTQGAGQKSLWQHLEDDIVIDDDG